MKNDVQILNGVEAHEYDKTVFQQIKRIEDQKENIYIIKKKAAE